MSRTIFRVNPHSIVCLNVKELLARSRPHIWSLSDSNVIRIHNHLVRKRTLNHLAELAKWLTCVVSTYLYGTFDCILLSCHVRASEWIHHSLAKWLSVRLQTKWMWVGITLLPLKLQIWRLLRARSFLAIKQTIECGFTLKPVRDIIITYSQMHRTDKYLQHSSIIWPVWLNGWVFVYELSGCGFESRCYHLNFRYGACFEQGLLWHLGKL